MKKILFLICAVLMLSTACKNEAFFELERPVESPWTTLADFDRAAIGSYNTLFLTSDYNSGFNAWNMYKNDVGDDVACISSGFGWGYYRDAQNQKQFLPNVFTVAYRTIGSVNDALEYLEKNGGNPYPTINADDKKYNLDRVTGELYFLRGYAYYMLATVYCDAYVPGGANDAKRIPLLTKKAHSYTEAINSKVGTTKEIWEQIQSDFEKAYSLLPERYISGKMHPSYQAGRANKFATAAMLARTHFAKGEYEKAKGYTDFVIEQNGGDYNLSEDPIEAFNKNTLSRGKEVIMYLPLYDVTTAPQLHLMGESNNLRGPFVNGWTEASLDPTVIKRLGWQDNPKIDVNVTFKMEALRDKRFTQLMAVREPTSVPTANRYPERFYTDSKITYSTIFANKAFRGAPVGSNLAWNTNYPIIRLAEMYLTRSICRFKAGDKAGAASDLNIVRKRAWNATVAGMTYESSPNYVTILNITEAMIGDERLIEMFCEGDRIDYLRGLKVDVGNGNRAPVISAPVPYTDKSFVWAIPSVETDLNLGFQ